MDVVVTFLEGAQNPDQWNALSGMLWEYSRFSRMNQMTANPSGSPTGLGLGEPLFQMSGAPYAKGWGRPQNDGPALRAITLMRFAQELIRKGGEALVRAELYDGKIPTNTVIKADLEYVSHHWSDLSHDLWEEVPATHFFTRMVQRKALALGAVFADYLGDHPAAQWYREQAFNIGRTIERFWAPNAGYVVAMLDRPASHIFPKKDSNLDSAVILGALHGDLGDGYFTARDYRIQATAKRLSAVFSQLYPINRTRPANVGVAIGRYPEDTYDGYTTKGEGNPWFLLTAGFAEFYYRLGQCAEGDTYLARVAMHMPQNLSMSEQMNKGNGFQQGANDLTWSYAALLTASFARSAAHCPN